MIIENCEYLNEYFSKKIKYESPLDKEITYCETVADLYNKCIKVHQEKILNNPNFYKWCNFIFGISGVKNFSDDNMIPIYWIRKYETGKVLDENGNEYKDVNGKKVKYKLAEKDKVSGKYITRWNTRRGALTIVANKLGVPKFGYIYVSNFDAQEMYNMILNVPNPSMKEYFEMIYSGAYFLHYDKGGSCIESDISFYNNYGHMRGGVLSDSGYYFAHIYDVNGEYFYDNNCVEKAFIDKLFPLGESKQNSNWDMVSDWLELKKIEKDQEKYKILNNAKIFCNDKNKRVRIISWDDRTIELGEKIMRAHFLRFIHPFNYFLVPAKKYSFNAITSVIGEYRPLISYVKERQNNIINSNDRLREYYQIYLNNIMIGRGIDFENTINKENGKKIINMLYGVKLAHLAQEEKLTQNNIYVNNIGNLNNIVDDFNESIKNDKTQKFINMIFNNEKFDKEIIIKWGPKSEKNIDDMVKRIIEMGKNIMKDNEVDNISVDVFLENLKQ